MISKIMIYEEPLTASKKVFRGKKNSDILETPKPECFRDITRDATNHVYESIAGSLADVSSKP